ncbi:MAG: translation initiation factor IF-2 [Dehalococcoidia bacterium]|nr:translation initiation factor IF-2 [Dehalococcoidia bacterium]
MAREPSSPTTQMRSGREPGETRQRAGVSSKEVRLPQVVSVAHLAELIRANPIDIMKQLMRAGIMANINQAIDYDTAAAVVPAFGFHAVPEQQIAKGLRAQEQEQEDPLLLLPRPPIVTILGHVDHGKTTLLDAIRNTRVAAKEAGGITQHIGAYQVKYRDHPITFLDTPGHEAFTAMRARGADITDIAVLVVAADDGIMPQTLEAISHAKAAGVPIVVAINKIDMPNADPERVKRQLAENNLLVEEWGGEVVAVPVSAKVGTGIEDLLENILVVAEVAELKANPDRPARGVVVEARLDKSRGSVATLLVKSGTLKAGDYIVAGNIRGKVKALVNDAGQRIKRATPSMPTEVLGLSQLPQAGDTFMVVASEQEGRALVEERERQKAGRHISLEEMFSRIRAGESEELNLIIKADLQGSVEALRDSLNKLSTDKAQVRIIHAASGSITEADVFLGVASQAIILGFNTTLEAGARHVADAEGVEIRLYNVIYTLLEDVTSTLEGLIKPVLRDVVEGHATVRAVFALSSRITVAGAFVTDGRVQRSAWARVLRGGQVIHDGTISSLKRFKDDVREVAVGLECGIGLTAFNDIQEGDVIELHRQERES